MPDLIFDIIEAAITVLVIVIAPYIMFLTKKNKGLKGIDSL